MPLIVPVSVSDIGDEVWTRAGRALDPNNPTSILTRIGDPTGHTLPDLVAKFGDLGASLWAILGDPTGHTLTSLVAKLGDPKSAFDQAEHDQTYAIENQTPQNWNDILEHTMTTLQVLTVGIPANATITRETLLMVMDIMALEAPGGVNKIDVQIENRRAAGSWTVAWSEDDVLSLPDVDGARDSLVMVADATGLFSTAGTYEFRAKVQASLAKNTQYLYTGLYSIRYRLS